MTATDSLYRVSSFLSPNCTPPESWVAITSKHTDSTSGITLWDIDPNKIANIEPEEVYECLVDAYDVVNRRRCVTAHK